MKNITIKVPFQMFIDYLKNYMNIYDKEMIIQKVYKLDYTVFSDEQINDMVVDFLNTKPKDFILENELFFIVFQSKPNFVNDVMIGELSSSLDEKQKDEFLSYINRTIQ